MRCVEYLGKTTDCSILMNESLNLIKVMETDLLERIEVKEPSSAVMRETQHEISVKLRPFEIKTIRMVFERVDFSRREGEGSAGKHS